MSQLSLSRLDDGSLIGQLKGTEAVKLSATEAQEQGRLTEADRRRITQLLRTAASHIQTSPLLVNGGKRKEYDLQEVCGKTQEGVRQNWRPQLAESLYNFV